LRSPLSNEAANAAGHEHVLRIDVADDQLNGERATISLERTALENIWVRDASSTEHLVKQSISAQRIQSPGRIAVVIDGSKAMASMADRVADAIGKLPNDREVLLVLANDDLEGSQVRALTASAAAKAIRTGTFIGGHDNTEALTAALDALAGESNGGLVWVHGPQPVLLATTDWIQQRLARGGSVAHWYDVQVAPGLNAIVSEIEAEQAIENLSVPELGALLDRWRTGAAEMQIVRERVAIVGSPTLLDDEQTSTHLARLWARDEVSRLIHAQPASRERAIEIAARYQLVTPVTGAVVLETQQQYDAAGLTPVPPGTVPTIPEPEEWALMAVVLATLLFMVRRRVAQAMRVA
jgi:hypothetical protein